MGIGDEKLNKPEPPLMNLWEKQIFKQIIPVLSTKVV